MTKATCSIEDCAKPSRSRGWCWAHYQHWWRKGNANYTAQTSDQRFWSKVDKSGGCWLWTGAKNQEGYGLLRSGGEYKRAHRFAYEMLVGPIPDGQLIDHVCHNTSCVRAEHLRLATFKQNRENLAGSYSNSKSGVRGVYWNSRNHKWQAQVGHNGRQYHVGLFTSLREAEEAVTAKRNELFTHNILDRH
jgi:hypothetical protein